MLETKNKNRVGGKSPDACRRCCQGRGQVSATFTHGRSEVVCRSVGSEWLKKVGVSCANVLKRGGSAAVPQPRALSARTTRLPHDKKIETPKFWNINCGPKQS